jgi:hypothetical protein
MCSVVEKAVNQIWMVKVMIFVGDVLIFILIVIKGLPDNRGIFERNSKIALEYAYRIF